MVGLTDRQAAAVRMLWNDINPADFHVWYPLTGQFAAARGIELYYLRTGMDGLTDRRVRGGMNRADFHVWQFLVLVISRPKLPIVKAMNQSEHPSIGWLTNAWGNKFYSL